MVQVGWLQDFIALFTLIGSTLLGIGDSLVAMAGGGPSVPPVEIRVEIRVQLDAGDQRPEGTWIQETIETLEARFPGATVTELTSVDGQPTQFSISGPLKGTDAELRDIAIATGEFDLRMTASDVDARELGIDLAEEQRRVEAYLAAHPNKSVEDYNALESAEGGSPERLVYAVDEARGVSALVALVVETDQDWRFDETALSRVYVSADQGGRPAMGFEIHPSRQRDFLHFTGEHIDEQLAITVGSRILMRPKLNSPLETGGIIVGGGAPDPDTWEKEVNQFVRVLSAPRLPQRLQLVSIERRDH